ncbi:MAG TPA: MarR family winged helix-turn-helix transcriptional regulator [Burkholderiales bacterium]|nr:MarR family winged helix-turn-helix transcriptional regulator [Burkholderiales bacterium]
MTRDGDDFLEGMHDRPGYLVRRLQQIAVATFLHRTERAAITPVRYAVLYALYRQPRIDQTRLAALTALDRTSLGQVVEALVKKKMIRRRPDPDDLRRQVWELTPAGRRLLERIQAPVRASQEDLLAPLGARERKQLLALIGKVIAGHNGLTRPSGARRFRGTA